MPLLNRRPKSRRPSAHIHDLPSEILRPIFIATYPRSIFDLDSEVSSAESILLPRRLSHVCRRWREEALSFGELWSYLCLTERDVQRDHKKTLDIFRTFLHRSNVSPLNFRFRYHCQWNRFTAMYPPCDNKGELSTLVTITSALLDHQHRWQTVGLTLSYLQVPPQFPKMEIVNIPLIKNLSLKVRLHTHESKRFVPIIDLSHSPRLESFDIWGYHDVEICFDPPYYGLLKCRFSLDLHTPSNVATRFCSRILEAAPNLRSMEFNAHTDADITAAYVVEPPESRPLKELYLRMGRLHGQIFDGMHLPELEKLVYNIPVSEGRTLLTMIQRSRPPLTSLDIGFLPSGNLIRMLRLLPTLVEFTFTLYRDDHVLRALEVQRAMHNNLDRGQTVLCPQLRDLRLQVCGSVPEETAGVLTNAIFIMLDSRMMNLGTLNKMFLSELYSRPDDDRVEISLQSPDHSVMKLVFNDGGTLIIETSR